MSNTTTITGNLTREPEIRYTREGQATSQLGVAVNRRWQDRTTAEWQETTSFFDVVCWHDLAENVALSLTKGTRVVVTGRLEQRSWETEDGEHRSKVEIVADEVGPSLRFATADVHRTERRRGADEPVEEGDNETASSAGLHPDPSRQRTRLSPGVAARPGPGAALAEFMHPGAYRCPEQ
jgi:single-strand DNA-binding protein